jgi:hypothetical protein
LPDVGIYRSRAPYPADRRFRHARNLPIKSNRYSCISPLSRQNCTRRRAGSRLPGAHSRSRHRTSPGAVRGVRQFQLWRGLKISPPTISAKRQGRPLGQFGSKSSEPHSKRFVPGASFTSGANPSMRSTVPSSGAAGSEVTLWPRPGAAPAASRCWQRSTAPHRVSQRNFVDRTEGHARTWFTPRQKTELWERWKSCCLMTGLQRTRLSRNSGCWSQSFALGYRLWSSSRRQGIALHDVTNGVFGHCAGGYLKYRSCAGPRPLVDFDCGLDLLRRQTGRVLRSGTSQGIGLFGRSERAIIVNIGGGGRVERCLARGQVVDTSAADPKDGTRDNRSHSAKPRIFLWHLSIGSSA